MTTKKEHIFNLLIKEGYGFSETVAFFLRDMGITMSDIARRAGVDRSYVKRVIDGKRNSDRIRRSVAGALEFDPWRHHA